MCIRDSTTAIIGAAETDPDFNLNTEGEEGTGADRIQYLLPEGWNNQEALSVECTVWYQSLPPKWVAPMLEIEGDSLIDGFRQLYEDFAPVPERVASTSLDLVIDGVQDDIARSLQAWPNPTLDGALTIQGRSILGNYQLLDAAGRIVEQGTCTQRTLRLHLPANGTYFLRTEQGQVTLLRN